jgi:hypothetical protein
VRAQQAKAGRHVAIYWDGAIRLEVGVELFGPFAEQGEVVRSATPAGAVASATHLGPYSGLGAAHDAVRQWWGPNNHTLRPKLGDLRSLAARVEHRSVADPHRCLLPAGPLKQRVAMAEVLGTSAPKSSLTNLPLLDKTTSPNWLQWSNGTENRDGPPLQPKLLQDFAVRRPMFIRLYVFHPSPSPNLSLVFGIL